MSMQWTSCLRCWEPLQVPITLSHREHYCRTCREKLAGENEWKKACLEWMKGCSNCDPTHPWACPFCTATFYTKLRHLREEDEKIRNVDSPTNQGGV